MRVPGGKPVGAVALAVKAISGELDKGNLGDRRNYFLLLFQYFFLRYMINIEIIFKVHGLLI